MVQFTKKSQELLNFISSEFLFSPFPSDKPTKELFSFLYKNICFFQKKSIYPIPMFPKINKISIVPKPKQLSFDGLLFQIETHIDRNIRWKCEYEYTIGRRQIRLFCFTETRPSKSFITFWLTTTRLWFEIVSRFASADCNRELDVYFYMTSLTKYLPPGTKETINVSHVNTAFTYSCRAKNEIVLFRKEEWLKVLMHESFHSFGLDFSNMNNQACHRRIRTEMFPNLGLSEINVFEAYTEFWAEIWNIAFCVYLTLPSPTLTTFIQQSAAFLQIEQRFSCFQMVKTLQFMGLTYDSLCKQSNTTTTTPQFKEETNVLSYFIIKCILISNASLFFTWSKQHNKIPFVFSKNSKIQYDFCAFLFLIYRNPKFLHTIQESEEIFTKGKRNNFLNKNMRMTVFELIE